MGNLEAYNGRANARRSDRSPNPVTSDITHNSLYLHFLPHAVCHLCYDGVAHKHGGRAPGREETGWTLSRWWIR
jgi:hypothetical protein